MIELGWREWVALPDLGIVRLRAKIDTGARSSALHVDRQWRFHDAGAPWIGFQLTTGRAGREQVEARAPIFDQRAVTDSGGHRCVRVFIQTMVQVAGEQRRIEVNLSDRCAMRFPMLLGRTGLEGSFTVDPASSFLHSRPARQIGHHT